MIWRFCSRRGWPVWTTRGGIRCVICRQTAGLILATSPYWPAPGAGESPEPGCPSCPPNSAGSCHYRACADHAQPVTGVLHRSTQGLKHARRSFHEIATRIARRWGGRIVRSGQKRHEAGPPQSRLTRFVITGIIFLLFHWTGIPFSCLLPWSPASAARPLHL